MAFLQALEGVFGLLLIGLVGYVLAARNWFSAETRLMLPKFVTCVALPPYLMYTIIHSFRRDDLLHLIQGALLPFASVALTFALAVVLARISGVQKRHFGLFCASMSNSNTVFVGIPVNMALFGENALPYVLLYYFASTTFFWTVGQYAISRDKQADGGKLRAGHMLKQIFSPPLLGFLTGLALTLCNLELPAFLQSAARYLGNLTTPLALLYLGIAIQGMGLRGLKISRDLALALAGRMVLSPLIMAGLAYYAGVPELMRKVFIVQASLPVMMQTAILSAHYRTDPEFGALAVSLSTLLSILSIPLCMALI